MNPSNTSFNASEWAELTQAEAGELETHIVQLLGGQVRDLQILVTSQGLTLRGRALNYLARHRAEVEVQVATGATRVINDIYVA